MASPFGGSSAAEQDAVRKVVGNALPNAACSIDGKPENCAKAANFISEHMKN